MRTTSKFIAAGLIAVSAPLLAGAAAAAPLGGPRALSGVEGAAAPVQTVQFRRGWRGGWHGGWRRGGGRWIGPAAGLAAGAVIGSALASPYYYGPGYYDDYAYGPAYAYEPYVAVSPPAAVAGGGDDAYCSQRFRSYDPSSGTYLGYDGQRHPCP